MTVISIKADKKIYSVSRLNQAARLLLEDGLGLVKVEGEVSNLARPSSGHIYFRLKDERAQIQCAFFRNRANKLNFDLENGQQVMLSAHVSLYEARGDYQLIVEHIEKAGLGALQLKFEALKKKLDEEGLFDEALKKELPELPKAIGIISSKTAAAFHDILTTLRRRFPAIPVILYPTQVQGADAHKAIIKALEKANSHNHCDVLIMARGGGSIEDLWCFNEEALARAMVKSKLPIITGIGHEIDFTIADFVADLRAPTPTAAAECATEELEAYLNYLDDVAIQLVRFIKQKLRDKQLQLTHLKQRLKAPRELIYQHYQRLDLLNQRLMFLFDAKRKALESRCQALLTRLIKNSPKYRLSENKRRIDGLKQSLLRAMEALINQQKNRFIRLAALLDGKSPLKTLERGYSITTDNKGRLITSAKGLHINDEIRITLRKDKLICQLKDIIHEDA